MIKLTDLLTEEQSPKSKPFIYSPVGFSCHACRFYYKKDDKHMCGNTYYKDYRGTDELVDDEGNQIKDPKKWCSNWFLPKTDETV